MHLTVLVWKIRFCKQPYISPQEVFLLPLTWSSQADRTFKHISDGFKWHIYIYIYICSELRGFINDSGAGGWKTAGAGGIGGIGSRGLIDGGGGGCIASVLFCHLFFFLCFHFRLKALDISVRKVEFYLKNWYRGQLGMSYRKVSKGYNPLIRFFCFSKLDFLFVD